MAENDLGNDLESLANELGGGEGGDASSNEGMQLDPELQAMANESAPAEGGDAIPSDIGGGEGGDLPNLDLNLGGGGGESTMPATSEAGGNLDFLYDIKLHVTFEVGRAKMLISDLLTLGQGSVIELHRLVGDELDLLINGKLIAKGEVIVVNEKFGCKITNIVSPQDRVRYMGGY